MEPVVSDSTCLIGFERIRKLEILPKLFGCVLVPPAVLSEFGSQFDWIAVEQLADSTLSNLLRMTVGSGEAEAIALAIQMKHQLITDDKQARSIAEQLGVKVKGTLGVLLLAKQAGIIENVRSNVDALELNGFHLSEALRDEILRIANE